MEKVFAINNVAYASNGAGGTINKLNLVAGLAIGAIGFYNEKGTLLLSTDADFLDCKDFFIAANIGGDIRVSKGIERQMISYVEQGAYVAPVMHKVIIGGTTAQTRLTIDDDDEGDVQITLSDNTFSSMFATNSVVASVYKKLSMTGEATVDALVAKLNANVNIPGTAAKIGSVGNFGITFQTATRGQSISVSLQGLIERNQIITNGTSPGALPVNGSGVGEDVYEIERQASMYLGNTESQYLSAEFYSAPFGTVKTGTYSTLIFREELRKPYIGETNVKPTYFIFVPSDEDTNLMTTILGVLGKLVGGRFIAATNIEGGNDNDPGDTDGA